MNRRDRHAQVSALKASGLTFRQIAEQLGLAISTVTDAYYDPSGDKARERKLRAGVPCADCGTALNTSGSVTNVQLRCLLCEGLRRRAESRKWIVESIQEWALTFGAPPSSVDWNPAMARKGYCGWKAERYERTGVRWPSPNLVINNFGSWNEGLTAAGFRALTPSEHWIGHAGIALRDEDEVAA